MKQYLTSYFVRTYNISVWTTLREFVSKKTEKLKIFKEIRRLLRDELPELRRQNLRNPRIFDIFSYCTFKAIAVYIKDDDLKLRFTQGVGKKIYNKIKDEEKFKISGNPDDLTNIKTVLEKIGQYFQKAGYITGFHFRWKKIFDENRWRREGIGNFAYTMENPVILPSAQRLFSEEGFAQHLSSRTLESALLNYKIEGRELEDFDPTQFNAESVEEIWEIRKINNPL